MKLYYCEFPNQAIVEKRFRHHFTRMEEIFGEQNKSFQPPGIHRHPGEDPPPHPGPGPGPEDTRRPSVHIGALLSLVVELGDFGSFRIESLRIRKIQTKNLKLNAN